MRAAPQTKIGNVTDDARIEVRHDEVVDRDREAEEKCRQDRGRDQRQRHLPKRRQLVGAQVHRGFLEMAVEPDQPSLHGDDSEADAEHHVRDQDRAEAERHEREMKEEREQRGAEDDLRRRERQEDQDVRRRTGAESVADERQRDHRAERSRHQARDQGDLEREDDRALDAWNSVPVAPVVPREALPGVVELADRVVEREDHDDRDRQQQVDEEENRVDGQDVTLDERPRRGEDAAPRPAGLNGNGTQSAVPVNCSVPTTNA